MNGFPFRKDGGFVREFLLLPATLGAGSVWDLDFSPDRAQGTLLAADGENNFVWLLGREDGAGRGRRLEQQGR